MSAFEADDRSLKDWHLLLSGIAFVAVVSVLTMLGIAKSQGDFEETVRVTAVMKDIGDGLPVKSDVKYRGVLVGMVSEIGRSDSGASLIGIDLKPQHARGIPASVTARVVPSNVFAVPSVQLVDNGPGPGITADARIPQDTSLETVRLQTSLTSLAKIVEAAGRTKDDPTVGILETVREATSGRGDEMLKAGARLDRIVTALNEVSTPDGTGSTIEALKLALDGLRGSAPDLLNAVNQAVIPMQTVAAQRTQLADLLTGGLYTTGEIGTALQNHTGTITGITANYAPVLDVIGAGSANFPQIGTSVRNLSGKFVTDFWNVEQQNGVAKIIVELTPNRQFAAADCPRYGELAGASCATAPEGPQVLEKGPPAMPAAAVEGPVAGGAAEGEQISRITGRAPDAVSHLLLGPLLRGNDLTVTPVADAEPTAGGPR